ncbi:hypothetical protein CVS42_19445 [Aeromonas veronii]|uniref:hypothetical protein n=1 Tax=Aeromonas veronii TaxID=654 RepID=UPI000C28641C|nr:hypothetical protein [Aeromonas veronii]ATY82828.1 hypothetical protein CVS42_19445 [Aeromonas veronii]HEA3202695.1 hypothetical protein [Aeromonas veronii]
MKRIIYDLWSNTKDYSSFIQDYPESEESIMGRSVDNFWGAFDNYSPICLELSRSDTGKKNYQFDFSGSLSPFLVFSEHAIEKIGDILLPRGQILPVITESKKKKFFGYYPTNPLKGCLDKENSVYREYPKGLMIDKLVLIDKNISDEYLFSIEEHISGVFVTEKFKTRIEEAGLLGFDFSREIQTT